MSDHGTAWLWIVTAVAGIESQLNAWLMSSHGLGLTEYRAIAHLSVAPDHELRITELAQRVSLNQSSATRLVGRLESKGLAVRDTCPDDGRGVYAVLTDRGIFLARKLTTPYTDKLTELLNGFTINIQNDEAGTLRDAFREIGDQIS
jgi:transcriptional regulator, MarR family